MTSFDPFATTETATGPLGFDTEMTEAGGGSYPNMHQLVGRCLLVRPLECRLTDDTFNPGKQKETWVADVVVLSGDSITEKVSEDGFEKKPFDEPILTGAGATLLSEMFISQAGLKVWCKQKRNAPNYAQLPWILGVINRTRPRKVGQKAGYTFGDPTRAKGTAPYSPEHAALATAWLSAHPNA